MLNIIPDYELFALGERVSTVSNKVVAPATSSAKAPARGKKSAATTPKFKRVAPSSLPPSAGPSGPMLYDGGPSGPMLYDGGPSGPMLYDGGPSGPMLV